MQVVFVFLCYNVLYKPTVFIIIKNEFYLIHVVNTTLVINLSFMKLVLPYQIIPVRTIFDTAPRFNALVTYFRRASSIFHITIYTCTINNWFKWILSKIKITNMKENAYLFSLMKLQITLARPINEFILTTRWNRNAYVFFSIQELTEMMSPKTFISPPSLFILLGYFLFYNINNSMFFVRVNSI